MRAFGTLVSVANELAYSEGKEDSCAVSVAADRGPAGVESQRRKEGPQLPEEDSTTVAEEVFKRCTYIFDVVSTSTSEREVDIRSRREGSGETTDNKLDGLFCFCTRM